MTKHVQTPPAIPSQDDNSPRSSRVVCVAKARAENQDTRGIRIEGVSPGVSFRLAWGFAAETARQWVKDRRLPDRRLHSFNRMGEPLRGHQEGPGAGAATSNQDGR
jgi:hypothetical protein